MANEDKKRALDAAIAKLEKDFGKGTVMRLGDPAAQVAVETIPTGSLSLDLALGLGGVPKGRIVEIYGPESSGKTTVALHMIAEVQKRGGIAGFIDAEHALDLYQPPLLLVDMGTATTVTVLDEQGAFRGGAILPGANLALSSLAGGTALLPDIPLAVPDRAIGDDTLTCMQSGCVLGSALLLDGLIDRMEAELGRKATVVATGGIAPVIAPACRHEMHMAADLILRGLAVLYEQNK